MLIATSNFLIPNATIIFELVIFLIVTGVTAKFILPPIQHVLEQRKLRIRSDIEAAEQARSARRAGVGRAQADPRGGAGGCPFDRGSGEPRCGEHSGRGPATGSGGVRGADQRGGAGDRATAEAGTGRGRAVPADTGHGGRRAGDRRDRGSRQVPGTGRRGADGMGDGARRRCGCTFRRRHRHYRHTTTGGGTTGAGDGR